MTDNSDEVLKAESAQAPQEGGEQPVPAVPSVETGDKQPSTQAFNADAIVEQLAGRLDKLVEDKVSRTFQSAKDRRYASVERIHKYLQEADGDPAKAVRLMQIDELDERLASETSGGSGGDGDDSNRAFMEARSAQILQEAGIDFEDADYKALVAQYAGRIQDPNQWVEVVGGFAKTRANKKSKQESIPAAAAASEGGGAAPDSGEEKDALLKELDDLYAGKLGSPTKPEARKRLAEIQSRLNELEPAAGPGPAG